MAALLGSANLLQGDVQGGCLRLGPLRLPVDHRDGPAVFTLMSDRMSLDRPAWQAVCLPGVMGAAVMRGPYRMMRVDTAAGPVEVAAGMVNRSPGSAVEVWFDPVGLWPIPHPATPPASIPTSTSTAASPVIVGGVR